MEKEKNVIATLQELLAGRNADFDASKSIKIVRHADSRKDLPIEGKTYRTTLLELYRYDKDMFMRYQNEQLKGTFDKTDYIVVCVGTQNTKARFVAVYKIGEIVPSPYDSRCCLLSLQEVDDFRFLADRVTIEWGKATVAWHQDFRKQLKPVTRIDEGFEDADGVPQFRRYEDVVLPYGELKAIFSKEAESWKNPLQSVNGIYLIQDAKTGKQYVGSTYGQEGIWGRWKCYFTTGGHGGNKDLEKLIADDPEYARHFQWCILEIMYLGVTEEYAIERENLYKRKFMTREFGYNNN